MAAGAALNAEPSQPSERAAQHLPAKSYAEAAEQTPPSTPPKSSLNGVAAFEDAHSPSKERQGSATSESTLGGSISNSNGTAVKERVQQENGSMVQEKRYTNGDSLTGIRASDEDEEESHRARLEEKKRDVELVSGRRAGAGWDRSRYHPVL